MMVSPSPLIIKIFLVMSKGQEIYLKNPVFATEADVPFDMSLQHTD